MIVTRALVLTELKYALIKIAKLFTVMVSS